MRTMVAEGSKKLIATKGCIGAKNYIENRFSKTCVLSVTNVLILVLFSVKFLQRHSSSARPRVSGCGHRLHHLRGGGEGPERRLEDRLS